MESIIAFIITIGIVIWGCNWCAKSYHQNNPENWDNK
jgi:hypothetical protein